MSTGLTTFYQFWFVCFCLYLVASLLIAVSFRAYICPIAGAYIADTYWGRYKTICWSVVVAMLGHIIMIVSSIPGIIGSRASLGIFILSMIITSTGTGGFKSNVSPLVAEQYRIKKCYITTTSSGERVIVDPAMTTTRIYMVGRVQCTFQAATDTTCSISIFLSTSVLSLVRSEWFMRKRYVPK